MIEEEIRRVASLAKIRFSDTELSEISSQLDSIMLMIKEMRAVNCDNVKPLTSVCEQDPFTSEDVVTESDISDNLFSNIEGRDAAFAKQVKCFIVPKVVE